jgi:hypothetical protein
LKSLTPIQSVPKKIKIVQSKNQTSPEAAGSTAEVNPRRPSRPRRAATSRKTPGTRDKKIATAQKTKGSTSPDVRGPTEPSDEQIRLRAYFISERRRRFALPGDAESDWLEARRQLLSE